MMWPYETVLRMSTPEIIARLRRAGHRVWEVNGTSLRTPGGASRIHALIHSWARRYPVGRWSPEEIQLYHELAVRAMHAWGFQHHSPIEPELRAALSRRGA